MKPPKNPNLDFTERKQRCSTSLIYLRNANQNHSEVPFHWSEWLLSKSLQTINVGEGVEKREHSCTVGGNVN